MDIWNPWHGCRKYSEGCENCYMYYLDSERDRDGSEIYKVKNNFNLPVKRDRKGNYKVKSGATLHVCLTSDFFLEEADGWRGDVWAMIKEREDVRFIILTKRAERIKDNLPPTGERVILTCRFALPPKISGAPTRGYRAFFPFPRRTAGS